MIMGVHPHLFMRSYFTERMTDSIIKGVSFLVTRVTNIFLLIICLFYSAFADLAVTSVM